MDIPDAATAFEEARRVPCHRPHPRAYKRAMTAVLTSISRSVAAGMTSTVVDVPTFVFGEPHFSVDEVTEYVRTRLEPLGYEVNTFAGVPSVAIAWGDTSQGRVQSRKRATSPPAHTTRERYDVGL